jgi:hypothetical protein
MSNSSSDDSLFLGTVLRTIDRAPFARDCRVFGRKDSARNLLRDNSSSESNVFSIRSLILSALRCQ